MKYINIIFEKEVYKYGTNGGACVNESNATWVTEKTQALVPFSDLNTRYDTGISYKDNFEKFVSDSFECGFVYLSDEYAIPVFKILAFIAHKEKDEKPDVDKKEVAIPSPHEVIKESVDTSGHKNERIDKRMKRHGRWRNFRRNMRPQGSSAPVPNIPNLPPVPPKEPSVGTPQ